MRLMSSYLYQSPRPLPSVSRNNMLPTQCRYTHYTCYTCYTSPAPVNSQGLSHLWQRQGTVFPSSSRRSGVGAFMAARASFIPQVPCSRTCRPGESSPQAAAFLRRTRVPRRTHAFVTKFRVWIGGVGYPCNLKFAQVATTLQPGSPTLLLSPLSKYQRCPFVLPHLLTIIIPEMTSIPPRRDNPESYVLTAMRRSP